MDQEGFPGVESLPGLPIHPVEDSTRGTKELGGFKYAASQLFKLLDKNRPEDKMERLKAHSIPIAEGKED